MLSDAPAFLFSERFYLEIWIGVKIHVQQAKRALVRRWLDLSGGMARRTADLPIHQSRRIGRSAEDQKIVTVVRFRQVDSSAGAITVNV